MTKIKVVKYIHEMEPGEVGYTVPWAVQVVNTERRGYWWLGPFSPVVMEQRVEIRGDYTFWPTPVKTRTLRVKRVPGGVEIEPLESVELPRSKHRYPSEWKPLAVTNVNPES